MIKAIILILFAFSIFLTGCASNNQFHISTINKGSEYLLADVNIVDVKTGDIHASKNVLIKDGAIKAIFDADNREAMNGRQRLFGARGLYLMPGLIDGHVHLFGKMEPPGSLLPADIELNAQRMLYAGITTAVDLGGPVRSLEKLDKKYERHEFTGPDLIYSGNAITAFGGYPTTWAKFYRWPTSLVAARIMANEVSNRADIDRILGRIKAHGGDLVKIGFERQFTSAPQLSKEFLNYICERAKAHDLKVFVHLGDNQEAWQALLAGVDVFTHQIHREPILSSTLEYIKKKGVKIIPTAGVYDRASSIYHNQSPISWSPMTKALTSQSTFKKLDKFSRSSKIGFHPHIKNYLDGVAAQKEIRRGNLERLIASDIDLIIGSDSPVMGWQAGAALHEELGVLEKAGISVPDLIRKVTHDNAKHLALADRGDVKPGLRADLVLLKENPLESLDALNSIQFVIARGKIAKVGSKH